MSRPAGVCLGNHELPQSEQEASGRLVEHGADTDYAIDHAEALRPFLMSVVSDSDHWLFVSSNGALTAGRRNAKFALFPYTTEDKLTDSVNVSGPYTALIAERAGTSRLWEPFRDSSELVYRVERTLEKSTLGNQLSFAELNQDLELAFSYRWSTSHEFGFVRECTLENRGRDAVSVRLLDGLQNLLPADVDEQMQLGFSCLLDAYKKNELVENTTLALYTLAAQVVDRAEPRESLHASSVWSHGLPGAKVRLSSEHNRRFSLGNLPEPAREVRGRRGAYLLEATVDLAPGEKKRWLIVADVNRTQAALGSLLVALAKPEALVQRVHADVARGSENLKKILADTDGLQHSADRVTAWHHTANVLFNDLRGGIYAHGYDVPSADFARFVKTWNRAAYTRHQALLTELPPLSSRRTLAESVEQTGDADLIRLAYEYLPLTFSRRHGDPSRPWNRFEIRVRDEKGQKLLGFQGNWRDIFQNWEALSLSYPDFVENIIVKFVNASTAEGYNPYRITQDGIDWEVPEPDHPWASIGYWGDHQIIYLCKLLELSHSHHPERLSRLLERELFTYADVPYRIVSYEKILNNVRDTIEFDHDKHRRIMQRVPEIGSDAKLLWNARGLHRVTLLEKLIVTTLGKLGNFVPGGGIWLNTGRPEWNDANNALVGYGLSMVTLYYLERFLVLLAELTSSLDARVSLSREVAAWLERTSAVLREHAPLLEAGKVDDRARRKIMDALGGAASTYREALYQRGLEEKIELEADQVRELVALAGRWLEQSIAQNRRDDGLYHAYNLLAFHADGSVGVEHLYEMLEGQVAALSTRELEPAEALRVLEALAKSRMYRPDQKSYTLYPDRVLPKFLDKNRISSADLSRAKVLGAMLEAGDARIVERDAQDNVRFHADFYNADRARAALELVRSEGKYAALDEAEIARILEVYERTFDHRTFTGRSGTMFGYEGLGSIYWHMVAKLLLAANERVFAASDQGAPREVVRALGERYYAIRDGLGGFNKTPSVYGAFPLDPYSHTPSHTGARQPGMTGQVKEEVIARFAELGVRVKAGRIEFQPLLLRNSEFLREPGVFESFDVRGKPLRIELSPGTLGFTYCSVPIVYHLADAPRVELTLSDGIRVEQSGRALTTEQSSEIFSRSATVVRIDVWTKLGL
ncbi:MAG TPA: hypothetical protein VHV51_22835 [Polyangiaceae bacterium]|nr:hypothetical protein [Polyangiaceae bacterium]